MAPPLGYVWFNWQTLASKNQGANRVSTGLVLRPEDGAGVSAALTQILLEQAFGVLWYFLEGGLSDRYIIGNGTPPVGGYTPTTRPIEIKGGEGLTMTAPLSVADLRSSLPMSATQPVPTADPGANTLHSTNVEKAWANITTDGAGGYTINDGFNIASCTLNAAYVEVTWARAFANANYAATVTVFSAGATFYVACLTLQTSASVKVAIASILAAVADIDPTATAIRFAIRASGRH